MGTVTASAERNTTAGALDGLGDALNLLARPLDEICLRRTTTACFGPFVLQASTNGARRWGKATVSRKDGKLIMFGGIWDYSEVKGDTVVICHPDG